MTAHSFFSLKRPLVGFSVVILFGLVAAPAAPIDALTVDDLDPAKEWRLVALHFNGNTRFSDDELGDALTTKIRPWYLPWRKHTPFDSVAFTTDLERLARFYQSRGYYETGISYELIPEEDETDALIAALITITEGEPVHVQELTVQLADQEHADRPTAPPFPAQHSQLRQTSAAALSVRATFETELPRLRASLPLKEGDIFNEEQYKEAEATLKAFFLERGYGWTEIDRKAEVVLDQHTAQLRYTVDPGPPTVFGQTEIDGLKNVTEDLVTREITYQPGEQFSLAQLKASRAKIVDLGLFHSVQISPAKTDDRPPQVPMRIRVEERPPRDFKLGLGYGTEDQFRGQLEWNNRNWFGGGRRLSSLLTFSALTRSLGLQFVQPYFPTRRSQIVVDITQGQEDEQTFLLNFSRFRPRLEHQFSNTVFAFLGYRLEFGKLNSVSPSTIRGVGGFRREGILSGPTMGVEWNTTEDPFDPKQGGAVSVNADLIRKFWGADYQFYKIIAEIKRYQSIGWNTVLAGRVKLGLADAFGSSSNLPLFERMYAGGQMSVRGYGRRRLGPISDSDDPLGGLSLFEGSVELRRPVWKALNGTLFVDFGQVSTKANDIPLDDLKFSAGFGLGYATPLGPLQLYLGFPFDPPSGDAPLQVHFSVGQFF